MPRNHIFSPAFEDQVRRLIENASFSDDVLHSRAQTHLQVLRLPQYADIDVPPWVRRIRIFRPAREPDSDYTSSRLFNTMYQTSDQLRLRDGKRYVSAAICVCANRVEDMKGPPEEEPKRLAEELSHLASSWVAFMLWPCESKSSRTTSTRY